jgi:site-specific recombinase XerC
MGRVIVSTPTFPILLERFFTQRLMQQRQASAHTIASYRDTFRLLLKFVQKRLRKAPCTLSLENVDATIVIDFLDELEKVRKVTPRTRNLRLTAIHSFFRYVAFEAPAHAAQIQRVLAIPPKRFARKLVPKQNEPERVQFFDMRADLPRSGLPGGTFTPLEGAAFPRRTPGADIRSSPSEHRLRHVDKGAQLWRH